MHLAHRRVVCDGEGDGYIKCEAENATDSSYT